ncbi:MAG: hypothetical protein AAFN07_12470 [Pseudomonadota bacterium]
MSTTFVLPEQGAVADLLGIVLGDGLGVNAGDAESFDGQYVATYIDDNDKLVAIGGGDPAFVAYAGAALSMIPAGTAQDMIDNNDITEAISDNFYEVMNICSRLLMTEKDDQHLRLDKTLSPGEAAEYVSQLSANGTPVGFELNVPNYGAGRLSFLVT